MFGCLHLYRDSDRKHPQFRAGITTIISASASTCYKTNHTQNTWWLMQNKKSNFITVGWMASYRNVTDVLTLISFKAEVIFHLFYGFDYMETKSLSNRYKPLHNLLFISLPVPHFSLKDLFFLINFLQNDTKHKIISDFTSFMFHHSHPYIPC